MKEIIVTVKFKEGLHARPAVKLIKLVNKMSSQITLSKGGAFVPANSITAVLGACILCGDEITLRAEGPQEDEDITALGEFFAGAM